MRLSTITNIRRSIRDPYLVLVILISLFGFIIRIINLEGPSFWNDESLTALIASQILKRGVPLMPMQVTNPDVIGVTLESFSPLHAYIVAFAYLLLGVSDFSARLPSVILGTLVIPLVHILGRKIQSKNLGIAACLLVAFSNWNMGWSRQARMYVLFQFLSVVVIIMFHKVFLEKRFSIRNFILLIVSSIMVFLSHPFGILVPFTLIFIYIIYALKGRISSSFNYELKEHNKIEIQTTVIFSKQQIYILLGLIVIIFLGAAFAEFTSAFLTTIARKPFEIISSGSMAFRFIPNRLLIYDYSLEFFIRTTYPILFALFFLGLLILLAKNFKAGILLGVFFGIPFLFFSIVVGTFTASQVYSRWIFFAIPAFYMLSVVPIVTAIEKIFGHILKKVKTWTQSLSLPVLLLIVFLLMYIQPLGFGFTNKSAITYVYDSSGLEPNYKFASLYVKQVMQPGDVVVSDWPENAYYYIGKCDYWLTDEEFAHQIAGVSVNGSVLYYVTGSKLIGSLQELVEIIKNHNRGWLILGKYSWGSYNSMLDFIDMFLEYHPRGSDDSIMIYSWDTSEAKNLTFSEDFKGQLSNQWSVSDEGNIKIDTTSEGKFIFDTIQTGKTAFIYTDLFEANGSVEIRFRFNRFAPKALILLIMRTDGGWFGARLPDHFVYFDDVAGVSIELASIDDSWHTFKIEYTGKSRVIWFDDKFYGIIISQGTFSRIILGNSDRAQDIGGSATIDWIRVTMTPR